MSDIALFTNAAADQIQQVVRDFKRNPPDPRTMGRPPASGVRANCVGILLADLPNRGKADMAIINLISDSTIQEVKLLGSGISAGTFTLGFKGQVTPALPWNCSATAMQAALEKLSTIGKRNVSVSLGQNDYTNADNVPSTTQAEFPGIWLVSFIGVFAGRTDTPLLDVVNSVAGTSPTVMVSETTHWADSGSVETANCVIPVGTPTPMRAGAVVACGWFPGVGYGVLACEPRQFSSFY